MKLKFLSVVGFVMQLLLGSAITLAAENFLDPEQAFKLESRTVGDKIELNWVIAPGYHLYAERIEVKAKDAGVELATVLLPKGDSKFDVNFGKVMTLLADRASLALALTKNPGGLKSLEIEVISQGCADAGLCYPPQTLALVLPAPTVTSTLPGATANANLSSSDSAGVKAEPTASDDQKIASALSSGSLWRVALMFFGLGLLLSFTPCVLPMIPILSSIIVGASSEGTAQSKRAKGFGLSVAYSAGMILVYTSLGLAAGLLGEGLAAALQKPWVIATFSIALFGFGLAMFDVFTLQMPAALQNRLGEVSNRIPGGKFVGVFAMGGLSALIVGPCVAAPLAGALVYISKTGHVLVGGVALFFLSLGMSQPLLLTGLSAGKLLPRAGAWMEGVKRFFGLLLFATALWLANPILPQVIFVLACALLLLMAALWLGAFAAIPVGAGLAKTAGKAVGLVFAALAVMQLIGLASGGRDAMQPLKHLAQARASAGGASVIAKVAAVQFAPLASNAELQVALRKSDKPVVLDFYADWCTSCKEMEHGTFTDEKVVAMLNKTTLLRVDVTKNSAQDKELMKRFGLFGPPAIIVMKPTGEEMSGARVVGYSPAEKFLAQLGPFIQ